MITYATGTVTVTWTSAASPLQVPYKGCNLTVTYTGRQWRFNAANQGLWGNDLKVTLRGNENYMTYAPHTTTGAGTFSKYDVLVQRLNTDTGLYEVKETYEELSFTDASDAMYAPDVINDASDLVTLTDYGYLDVPSTFKGVSILAEATGFAPAPGGVVTAFAYQVPVADAAIVKSSLHLNVTDGIGAYVATADADGVITGTRVDATKTNTIDWATGDMVLNFSTAPTGLTADYIKYPTTPSVDYTLATGLDGTMALITRTRVSLYSALKATKKGLYALDRIDEILNLVIPDFGGDVNVQSDMIDYCDNRRDCFAIICTPSGRSAQQAVDWNRITFNKKSKYAALYWPWVNVADPLANNRALLVHPVAHIAGIFARTDTNKNVGKAPEGKIDGALRGVMSLEMNPDKAERDTVYPARVNPLINTPQTGMCVWGARTLSPTSDDFKWINAVRLFIYVEKAVFNSTHGFVFENINNNLYASIKGSLDSFLLGLFNQGYFAGSTTSAAYEVVCDTSNNPASVVNAGQVIVDVAIAPNKPGEFIRFRFAPKAIT
jgi:hypothetical protein